MLLLICTFDRFSFFLQEIQTTPTLSASDGDAFDENVGYRFAAGKYDELAPSTFFQNIQAVFDFYIISAQVSQISS